MNVVETPQSACRCGVARADITPPEGIYHRMWGAATHDRAAGVHRPLTATAIVFQPLEPADGPDGQQILVAIDHCLLGKQESDAIRQAISHAAGVDVEAVLLAYSHTHAAGLMSLDREELPGGNLIPEYLERLGETCVKLVRDALRGAEPATICYGTGHCTLAAHRDYWDEKRAEFVCGYNPRAAADDTLLVARITSERGQVLATVVNYACHPTTLAWDNQLISPDYVGSMRELIEQATDAACVFLQGASGELGPREGFVGDTEVADRNGRQLGYAALSALTALPPPATHYVYAGPVVSGATIGTWRHEPLPDGRRREIAAWQVERRELPLKYRPGLPTLDDVQDELQQWEVKEAAARSAGDEQEARDCRALAERRRRLAYRLASLPPGESFPFPFVLWRMGDAVWLAVEGEHYSVLQRRLREQFPQSPLIVTTLSNSWRPAYLPPADVYGKGIYQETVAVLDAGSLEQLIDAIGEQITLMLETPDV